MERHVVETVLRESLQKTLGDNFLGIRETRRISISQNDIAQVNQTDTIVLSKLN